MGNCDDEDSLGQIKEKVPERLSLALSSGAVGDLETENVLSLGWVDLVSIEGDLNSFFFHPNIFLINNCPTKKEKKMCPAADLRTTKSRIATSFNRQVMEVRRRWRVLVEEEEERVYTQRNLRNVAILFWWVNPTFFWNPLRWRSSKKNEKKKKKKYALTW